MRGHLKASRNSSGAALKLSVAGAIVLGSMSLASCSVADAEIAANESQPKKRQEETVRRTRPGIESYSYGSANGMNQASAGSDIMEMPQARETKIAYLGSAPYICSASGFGQKSRCFLR